MTKLLQPLIGNMIEKNNYDFMFGVDLNKLRSGDVKRIYAKLRAYIAISFLSTVGIVYLLYTLMNERNVKAKSEKYFLVSLYISMIAMFLLVIHRACTSLQTPELLVDFQTQLG